MFSTHLEILNSFQHSPYNQLYFNWICHGELEQDFLSRGDNSFVVSVYALGHWFGEIGGQNVPAPLSQVAGSKSEAVLLKTLLLHSPFRLQTPDTIWAHVEQGTKCTLHGLFQSTCRSYKQFQRGVYTFNMGAMQVYPQKQ